MPGKRQQPSASEVDSKANAALGGTPDDMYGAPEVEKEHENPTNLKMGYKKGGYKK